MIKGMSGFGQSHIENSSLKLSLEVRTLNHRYLDCSVYLPESLRSLEGYIKGIVKRKIKRGKVNVSFNITSKRHSYPKLNSGAVGAYIHLAKKLNKEFGVAQDISFWQLINLPGVLGERQKTLVSSQSIKRVLAIALSRAVDKTVKMRQKEGGAIYQDLKKRTLFIKGRISHIEQARSKIIKRMEKKLAFEELTSFAKACDISEELVRLKFHLQNLRHSAATASKESVGKELDFICQELQREINTLGAKLVDKNVSLAVVKIKSQLEKLREQLQNVE